MASLVQYPGGIKNRGGYGTGNYHVKLILPRSKRVRTFSTGTKNRIYAIKILDRVNNIEKLAKAENGTIIALYNDLKGDIGLVDSINEELGIDSKITLISSVDDYLNDCKLRVSVETVKSYKLALRDLCNALNKNIRISEISKADYSVVLGYLKNKFNDTTVNIRLRGIRAFLLWLVDKSVVVQSNTL